LSPPPPTSIIFSQSYVPHPALHSFPTRRSSDLEHDTIKCVLAYYASIGTFAGPRSPGTAYVLMYHLMGEHQGAGGWGFVRGGMGDRKSTRLNSSHLGISYAVFCLKKKKKKRIHN